MKFIELLAPAKDYESAVVAVDSGADAIYMGGSRFGARQAAGNSYEQIARAVDYAHRFGVRVHATLNTLLWDEELDEARNEAQRLIEAGVDALIVQDMALRRMNLPVELHASTQVSNMTAQGARFLGDVGFARVILERSLSLDEIRQIVQATSAQVECFVHGAICVGYSGRCFLSRSLSERSGNRGQCSQPCRLTWDLLDRDGRKILKNKHLLSVRDLNLSHRIGDLLDAGVTSFKIEGRLKDTGYIRNVVSYYRRAIDRELAVRSDLRRASVGVSRPDFEPDPSKSFTRGFTEYFFGGKHAGVASFDTPKAVGEYIGRVKKIDRNTFTLDQKHDLASGDGICFVVGGQMIGTNINRVDQGRVEPNRMEGIRLGQPIYRNADHRFNLSLERSRMRRVIPTEARVTVSNQRIELRYTDCEGLSAVVARSMTFDRAKNPDRNSEALKQQVAKSGDTIFEVGTVELEGGEWFVPASLMAELRREGLHELLCERQKAKIDHLILAERSDVVYPATEILAEENVTNHLSEAFYRDHGVQRIARPLERAEQMEGERVLRSAYCIRREIGQCLKEHPTLKGDLFIEHGTARYRLDFDCARCEMSLIKQSKNK